jgi:hypothetical protein
LKKSIVSYHNFIEFIKIDKKAIETRRSYLKSCILVDPIDELLGVDVNACGLVGLSTIGGVVY